MMTFLLSLLVSVLYAAPVNIETIFLPDSPGQKLNPDKKNNFIAVDIYSPKAKPVADLVVLPGWNFSRKRWQNETEILKYCQEKKYRCIFPEMGVTLYESRYFPETTLKWGFMPGGEWIQKILIPELQKKGMIRKNNKNYLLGLSTGGRGVALISLQNPGLFSGGAALSGDFNQAAMIKDRLMAAVYGDYAGNKGRWETLDNPEYEVISGNWKIPVYLGHGKNDKIVPFEQSREFYQNLKKKNPGLKIVFNEAPEAGHDFKFWNSQLKEIFEFFSGI